MRLHRLLATDHRTAMEQAVSRFGEDVLIISSARVGLQTELVLAVDEVQPLAAPTADAESASFRAHFQSLMGQPVEPPAPAPQPTFVCEPASDLVAPSPRACEPLLADADEEDQALAEQLLALVREELADVRQAFRMSQTLASSAPDMACSPAVQPLAEPLRECAMPGALRTLMQGALQGQPEPAQASQALRSQLLACVPVQSPEQAATPARGVHVLAGPSGAGKSTLAARLAQWGVQEFGAEQVALISYHDLRAGAWSQLQMLGAQAGVQVFRALDAGTLGLLLEEIGHRALVVIDTPGVQMAEHVQQIVALSPQAQVHAVLAADASPASCRRVLKDSAIAFAGLMLTKLDEADAPWALLQFLSNETQPPARSLVSRSDRLAQPLQIWSAQALVDHALRTSGLSAPEKEAFGMPSTSAWFAAQVGGLNG